MPYRHLVDELNPKPCPTGVFTVQTQPFLSLRGQGCPLSSHRPTLSPFLQLGRNSPPYSRAGEPVRHSSPPPVYCFHGDLCLLNPTRESARRSRGARRREPEAGGKGGCERLRGGRLLCPGRAQSCPGGRDPAFL